MSWSETELRAEHEYLNELSRRMLPLRNQLAEFTEQKGVHAWQLEMVEKAINALDQCVFDWESLSMVQEMVIDIMLGRQGDAKLAASRLASKRHVDNHADKVFVQDWYRKNKHRFRNRTEAATEASSQRLVSQKYSTIYNWIRKA
jgi:hypothetical protein